ncbi:MAG: glycoside hydrolase family 28 protein [Bacteroidales bacterium]|jgi:polygalacturonase|nr:glycoside hydrolase family 28 protein [Bacteroidales bacterium]
MKKFIIIIIIVTLCYGHLAFASSPWDEAKKIEAQIARTNFPNKVFNIKDFGAKPDNPEAPCHKAINDAILQCSLSGGGQVLIPAGTYYTGPVTLKSNVNLHLEEGATLKFSTNRSLYLPAVITRWEGVDCYNYHPLIYAYGERNIAITGKGTIDGQGSNEHWWPLCGSPRYGWKAGIVSQGQGGRKKLLGFEQSGAPIEERIMGENEALRPQLINLYKCNTILISDVKLTNSPFWVIHPLMCENLIVSGVHINSHGPNNDGCDPESSKNVLIEKCFFDTGDDCIAIKSGRNNDGRLWSIPSENIIVRGCKMLDGHGGVVIGSEISGGYKNLFVEDCDMDSPDLERVIRIKTNTCRGGIVENVFVRNIKVGQCKEAVLKINLLYEPREECNRGFPPTVRNVSLENVTCEKSQYGVLLVGLEESQNIYDISVKNSKFNNVAKGNQITGAKNVVLQNLSLNGEKADQTIN